MRFFISAVMLLAAVPAVAKTQDMRSFLRFVDARDYTLGCYDVAFEQLDNGRSDLLVVAVTASERCRSMELFEISYALEISHEQSVRVYQNLGGARWFSAAAQRLQKRRVGRAVAPL